MPISARGRTIKQKTAKSNVEILKDEILKKAECNSSQQVTAEVTKPKLQRAEVTVEVSKPKKYIKFNI